MIILHGAFVDDRIFVWGEAPNEAPKRPARAASKPGGALTYLAGVQFPQRRGFGDRVGLPFQEARADQMVAIHKPQSHSTDGTDGLRIAGSPDRRRPR